MAENLKVPPHSQVAEQSVLGAVLLDREAVTDVVEFLRPEHFYEEKHGKIFEAVMGLYQDREPVDIVSVAERLKKNKDLTTIGGSAYLTALVDKVPTAVHAEHYAHLVKDAYTKRQLISAAGKISEMAFDEGGDVRQILDTAEQNVFSLSQQHLKQVFVPVKDILAESFDRLDELHKSGGVLRGVPTGFSELDEVLAGMQNSNLLILAARPGVGKTALALNIAQFAAFKHKMPVGFFSLEMSREELMDRLLVAQAEIDAWKLKTGRLNEDEFSKLSDAMGELYETPLYIDDTPGMSILEMRTKARRLQAEHGLSLVIVDYLQLARPVRNLDNRVQEVSEVSQGLKNLARELKVPVLALSQLSRQVESRGIKKPQLADLRESGAIEQDADVVMFLWRENDEDLENMNLDIAKHRNGALKSIKMRFRGDRLKFYSIEGKRKGESNG
jgi:replicative DNA helicase